MLIIFIFEGSHLVSDKPTISFWIFTLINKSLTLSIQVPPFWHGASAHSSMFCSQYVPFQPVKSNCYLIWIRMENWTWCADTTSIEQSVQTLCPVETWRRISATKFIFPVQINFFMKWHFKQVSIKQVFLSENMYAWTVNLRPFWYSFC